VETVVEVVVVLHVTAFHFLPLYSLQSFLPTYSLQKIQDDDGEGMKRVQAE
jgi:hypothetical protein